MGQRACLAELHAFWVQRGQVDEYVGTLVNAWIAGGGVAHGIPAGRSYVDVGIVRGYREAIRLLTDDDTIAEPLHPAPRVLAPGAGPT